MLKVEALGTWTGEGSFTAAEHGVRASLQEEAGGSGYYFAASSAETIEMTVDCYDPGAGQVWGSWTVSGMTDNSGGSISLSPQPIPIWCPSL